MFLCEATVPQCSHSTCDDAIYAGFQPSADLALAFAVSRPLKQVRLPAEIAGAALLSRAFPQLRRVKFTEMYNHVIAKPQEQGSAGESPRGQQAE